MKILTGLFTSLIAVSSVSVHAESGFRFQQCEADLCGADSYYERIRGQGAFTLIDHETRAILDKEVKPLLGQLAQSSLENKKSEVALAEAFLKSSKQVMSAPVRAFFTVKVYLAKIQPQQDRVLISSDGRTLEVSAISLQKAFPDLSSSEVSNITAILNAYFGSDLYASYSSSQNFSFDLMNKTLGSDAKKFYVQTLGNVKFVIQNLGSEFASLLDTVPLQKLIDGKTLAPHEKLIAMSTISEAMHISATLIGDVQALTEKRKLTIQEAALLLDWGNNLKSMKMAFESPDYLDLQKIQVVDDCNKAIAGALAATPSALRQRKTNELLEMVKQATIETAPLYFSGQALAKVIETVKATQFSKPLSPVEARSLAKGSLQYFAAKETKYSKLLAAEGKSTGSKYLSWKSMVTPSGSENVFENLKNVCEKIKPEFFPDSAATWINQVRTGWQTNMFPEIGISILAHELGHIVSGVSGKLPQEKAGYDQVRTCIVEGHAKIAGSTLPSNFAQYAEEDWADAFSSRIVLNLEKNWPHFENSGCSMLHAAETMGPLELQDGSGIGSHSTSFLRALQIQVQLGRALPQSCLQAMTANETEAVTRSCTR